MRLHFKAALALLPAAAMGACAPQAPLSVSYPATHAQMLSPSNSMLGEACDGQERRHSVRLAGHTRLIARVDVSTIVAPGTEVPYSRVAAPADEGVSQMSRPQFARRTGPASCGGQALRTVMVRELGVLYLDWALELAVPDGGGAQPAEPWLVKGRAAVDEARGTAYGMAAFTAFGRPFVARMSASPGPVFVAETRAREAREAAARHPYPTFAAPLPDERPGRTLEDVTTGRR